MPAKRDGPRAPVDETADDAPDEAGGVADDVRDARVCGCIERVNPDTIPHKIAYFMAFFTFACVSPVLTVYLQGRGLSPQEIGIVGALQPFAGAVGAPLWTTLADYAGVHRVVLLCCAVVAVLVRAMLTVAPSFGAMVVIVLCADVVGSGVGPLLDVSTLQQLRGRRGDYGKSRLWGAVSWGIASLLVGLVVGWTGDTRAYFGMQVLAMLASLVPFYRVPFAKRRSGDIKPPLLRAMRDLFARPEVVAFFAVMLLMGILMGQITAFLFVYLAEELSAPPELFGLCLAVMCVTEVPLFFFAGHLIRRFGNDVVLHIGLLTYILRFVWYSYLSDPWLVLPAEALHGLTYAASWAASTDYAASIAPRGLEASMQGLLSGIHWGAGNGIGALVGGFVYAAYGGRVSFRVFAVVALVTHVLLFFSQWLKWRARSSSTRSTPVASTDGGSDDALGLADVEDDAIELIIPDAHTAKLAAPAGRGSYRQLQLGDATDADADDADDALS